MRPSHDTTSHLITFLYYVDLPRAIAFYEGVLCLPLAIDQGWCKIYRASAGGYIGLVDEKHGMNKANAIKPVQICLRVGDVDAWKAYLESNDVAMELAKDVPALGIRVIVFRDPEGYQIEIQSVL